MIRRLLIALALVVMVAIGALAGMIAFGTASPLPPLASVSDPFRRIDYGDLPPIESVRARDGTALAYRLYPGGAARVAVLIHGSAGGSSGMHVLAKALQAAGVTVYAPDMRGHGASGPHGDIAYIGQLDDDLADLMASVRPRYPQAAISLIGFSSGGGFTLRIAGGNYGTLFDNYVAIAPALCPGAPTCRMGGDSWAAVHIPRIIALRILGRLGVHWFEGLTVVAFAVQPGMESRLTAAYSARLAASFKVHDDYVADIRQASRQVAVLVGATDELFYADRFADVFHSVRADIPVTIVPGLGHIDMIMQPAALDAVRSIVLR